MSDIAIRVENVCKRFRLGEGKAFDNVREAVAHAATAPLRWLRGNAGLNGNGQSATANTSAAGTGGDDPDELWALRDVSFEVKRGEVLGIIGRNGAGKSTLLKILSRITEPTSGHIDIFGRVASLLEVGTGFHQDLTGRENIYLNGAILGMSRAEIKSKFDEIVAFAGVERFIDTPVKRYSSGMGVRLGFAVAAHLEPEILIVDEVLAVGDAEFQKRCIGKMDDVASSGRTVLFVSHNLSAVERLCHRCLLLEAGEVLRHGATDDVIQTYLRDAHAQQLCWHRTNVPSDQPCIEKVIVCDADGNPIDHVTSDSTIGVRIDCIVPSERPSLKLALVVADAHGQPLISTNPSDTSVAFPTEPGLHSYFVAFPEPLFMPQRYNLNVSLYEFGRAIDVRPSCIVIDVAEVASLVNSGYERRPGVMQLRCRWDRSMKASGVGAVSF